MFGWSRIARAAKSFEFVTTGAENGSAFVAQLEDKEKTKMKFNNASRFWLLFTIVWCLCAFATGCTTAWTTEASNIISLLVPAISSLLSILSAFGVGKGITTEGFAAIQKWSEEAQRGLNTVKSLIDQYTTAEASAQPGLLNQIQTALNTVVSNLAAILPAVHITNADTQAKVISIINLVSQELQALVNLVPALKGEVTAHDELKRLIADVKSPKEFKHDYNAAAREFGQEYQI